MKKDNKKEHHEYIEASEEMHNHHLLGAVWKSVSLITRDNMKNINWDKKSICFLSIETNSDASLYINKLKKINKEEWMFVYATVCIILSLDLYKKIANNKIKEIAVMTFAIQYVKNILGFTEIPNDWKDFYIIENEISFKNDNSVYEQMLALPEIAKKCKVFNFMYSLENPSIEFLNKPHKYYNMFANNAKQDFSTVFANNLILQAQRTITLKNNTRNLSQDEINKQNTEGYKAKKWFVNHFPLLSVLAASFDVIEDIQICKRLNIEIGAVSAVEKIIFINPLASLSQQGMRFVIAHEILHVALNHMSRCQGRDHLMWNLACDFVINHWLVEMGIGVAPSGVFLDKELSGKSADEIYLMIARDVRLRKKMVTFKNMQAGDITKNSNSACDMLDNDPKYFSEFEDACKEMLLRGLFLHNTIGRGTLPADMVEEIKSINQPPIPWQADLARWIAERFPAEESRRTYARPSRRQSSTPDIPRPAYVKPEDEKNTRTFGVILDTSGSMDRNLLAKCLGAISSYSAAQDVKYIRLVFCDAQPYDEGYVSVDILINKVNVKGRGGTCLQPAINLLENAIDFPDNAPILILSDGLIEEVLEIKNEHAFLVPNKTNLPFIPRGEVFEFK